MCKQACYKIFERTHRLSYLSLWPILFQTSLAWQPKPPRIKLKSTQILFLNKRSLNSSKDRQYSIKIGRKIHTSTGKNNMAVATSFQTCVSASISFRTASTSLPSSPSNNSFVSCPGLKSCPSFSLFLFPLIDRHRGRSRCLIRRNRRLKRGIMAEGLTLRGTLKGHNGWVTQIATNPQDPDKILSGSRGKYVCVLLNRCSLLVFCRTVGLFVV